MGTKIITFPDFLREQKILGIGGGDTKTDVIRKLGEPLFYEPQRKKNKGILSYGRLNVYIYNEKVLSFSFNNLLDDEDEMFYLDKINLSEILEMFNHIGLQFSYKKAESIYEYDFISFNKCQLGFMDNILCYFWVEI